MPSTASQPQENFTSQLPDLDLLDQVDVEDKIDLNDLFLSDRVENYDFSALPNSSSGEPPSLGEADAKPVAVARTTSDSSSSLSPKKRKAHGPSQRNPRKLKKPNGFPKRPLSSYNIFFKNERHRVFAAHSRDICFEELGKIIGRRWKALGKEGRKEYEQAALVDAKRYQKEMDAFDEKRRQRIHAAGAADVQPSLTSASKEPARRESFNTSPINAFDAAGTFPTMAVADAAEAVARMSAPSVATAPRYGPPDPLNQRQMPEGALVHLPDDLGLYHTYQVHYVCYRMTKSQAEDYLHRLVGRSPLDVPPPPEGARQV